MNCAPCKSGRPPVRLSAHFASARGFARGSPAEARRIPGHRPLYRGLPGKDPAGEGTLLLQGRTRSPASPAADLQWRRDRRKSQLDSHLRSPAGQGHLGPDRYGPSRLHGRLQRAADQRCARRQANPHRTVAAGTAGVDLSHLTGDRPIHPAGRQVARYPAELLRVPRGCAPRPAPVRHNAGSDGRLHPAHRRQVSLASVLAGDSHRLHRGHGERRRHDIGGLASRCPGLPGSSLVPAIADSARVGATNGSATWSPLETG